MASLTLIPIAPDIASTIGRVALGALFIVHGWPKIKDPRKTIGFVKGTGFPGGAAFAVLSSAGSRCSSGSSPRSWPP